ncbi:butyrophilin subfamily 1 member A1-like [Etheostoma cragini]|uniref:butyrophilin subfamily 1 member A1-like n=1 Tax=Etheostoma cragini TaxID=417921 RepID=UPI00155E04F7|nr:butyrophilin subfamily 1 member A1-like [Etheostoma cragini]
MAALFLSLWIVSVAGEDPELTVKPGQDVTLQCQAPGGAEIKRLTWSRPDLGSDYVFFFRDDRPYENYQNPAFRGRVNLIDPEMKDGDVSVVLKNVSVSDTGTYKCVVISGTNGPELIITNTLIVKDSGNTEGLSGVGRQTDGGDKNRGSKDLRLSSGLGLLLLLLLLSCWWLNP